MEVIRRERYSEHGCGVTRAGSATTEPTGDGAIGDFFLALELDGAIEPSK